MFPVLDGLARLVENEIASSAKLMLQVYQAHLSLSSFIFYFVCEYEILIQLNFLIFWL